MWWSGKSERGKVEAETRGNTLDRRRFDTPSCGCCPSTEPDSIILQPNPMARQAGPIYVSGTIDQLTFYRMQGEYYVRRKSSLTRAQFRKWSAFARSRLAAARFGAGSALASAVYQSIAKHRRPYGLFVKLKKHAITRMHAYVSPEIIEAELRAMVRQYSPVMPRPGAMNGDTAAAGKRSSASCSDDMLPQTLDTRPASVPARMQRSARAPVVRKLPHFLRRPRQRSERGSRSAEPVRLPSFASGAQVSHRSG